jgi:hypothetical protein
MSRPTLRSITPQSYAASVDGVQIGTIYAATGGHRPSSWRWYIGGDIPAVLHRTPEEAADSLHARIGGQDADL